MRQTWWAREASWGRDVVSCDCDCDWGSDRGRLQTSQYVFADPLGRSTLSVGTGGAGAIVSAVGGAE